MVDIFILFPITSSINNILPVSLNRVLLLLFIILLIFRQLCHGKIYKRSVCTLMFVAFFSANGIILTKEMSLNIENCIYWVTTIIVLLYISYRENRIALVKEFQKRQRFIGISAAITILINLIGFFVGSSFEATGAYRGFMVTSHSMASTMILGMALLLLYPKNKFHVIAVLLETLILFATEARTFMLPLAVLLYFELRLWVRDGKRRKFIIVCFMILVVLVLPYTGMAKKFVETLNNPYAVDWLSGLTNFRSTLWEGDICRFMTEPMYYKLFGNGFSYTYELHNELYGMKIWSHNDFFNLLIAVGVVGVICYLYILCSTIRRLHREHQSLFYTMLFSGMIFGTAFFNGFYLYIALVFAFTILAISPNITKTSDAS